MGEEIIRPIIIYSYDAVIFKFTLTIAAAIAISAALVIIIYATT